MQTGQEKQPNFVGKPSLVNLAHPTPVHSVFFRSQSLCNATNYQRAPQHARTFGKIERSLDYINTLFMRSNYDRLIRMQSIFSQHKSGQTSGHAYTINNAILNEANFTLNRLYHRCNQSLEKIISLETTTINNLHVTTVQPSCFFTNITRKESIQMLAELKNIVAIKQKCEDLKSELAHYFEKGIYHDMQKACYRATEEYPEYDNVEEEKKEEMNSHYVAMRLLYR